MSIALIGIGAIVAVLFYGLGEAIQGAMIRRCGPVAGTVIAGVVILAAAVAVTDALWLWSQHVEHRGASLLVGLVVGTSLAWMLGNRRSRRRTENSAET